MRLLSQRTIQSTLCDCTIGTESRLIAFKTTNGINEPIESTSNKLLRTNSFRQYSDDCKVHYNPTITLQSNTRLKRTKVLTNKYQPSQFLNTNNQYILLPSTKSIKTFQRHINNYYTFNNYSQVQQIHTFSTATTNAIDTAISIPSEFIDVSTVQRSTIDVEATQQSTPLVDNTALNQTKLNDSNESLTKESTMIISKQSMQSKGQRSNTDTKRNNVHSYYNRKVIEIFEELIFDYPRGTYSTYTYQKIHEVFELFITLKSPSAHAVNYAIELLERLTHEIRLDQVSTDTITIQPAPISTTETTTTTDNDNNTITTAPEQQQEPQQEQQSEQQPEQQQQGQQQSLSSPPTITNLDWLSKPKFLGKILNVWKHAANNGLDVIQPAELLRKLQTMSSKGSIIKYDIITMGIILDVIVKQQPPAIAPYVAEEIFACIKVEADRTNDPDIRIDAAIYSQLIKAWSCSGLVQAGDKIDSLIEEMKTSNIELTHIIYNVQIFYWLDQNNINRVEMLLDEMKKANISMNSVGGWGRLLSRFASIGRIDRAKEILGYVIEYIKLKDQNNQQRDVRKMDVLLLPIMQAYRDIIDVTINDNSESIDSASSKNKRGNTNTNNMNNKQTTLDRIAKDATDLCNWVDKEDVWVNAKERSTVYSALVDVLSKAGHLDKAEQLLHQIEDNYAVPPERRVYANLMWQISKLGTIDAAQRLEGMLRTMHEKGKTDPNLLPDTYCYHAAMQCWRMADTNHAADRVWALFAEMRGLNIPYDTLTLTTLITTLCSTDRLEWITTADDLMKEIEDKQRQTIQDASNHNFKPHYLSWRQYGPIMKGWFQLSNEVKCELTLARFMETAKWNKLYNVVENDKHPTRIEVIKWGPHIDKVIKCWVNAKDLYRATQIVEEIDRRVAAGSLDNGVTEQTYRYLIEQWRNSKLINKREYIAKLRSKLVLHRHNTV